MTNRILRISAAAAMIVATPAFAGAQSVAYNATSPVAITSFNVNASYESGMIGGELTEAPQFVASGITLKFVNNGNVPATTVTFLVNEGKFTQSIVEKGTFSPGVQIKHNFAAGSGLSAIFNVTCNVAEVDFTDGSSWHVARADVVKR